MPEIQVSDEEIEGLLRTAPAPEMSAQLPHKISSTLTTSLQPVKPMPGTGVLTFQFASVFLVFATALIAMMGVTGFRRRSSDLSPARPSCSPGARRRV